jgi:hypothetical protein
MTADIGINICRDTYSHQHQYLPEQSGHKYLTHPYGSRNVQADIYARFIVADINAGDCTYNLHYLKILVIHNL